MKTIEYNNPDLSDQREAVKPMSIADVEVVVDFINLLIGTPHIQKMAPTSIEALQRLIWNYENLDHHKSVTCGLWATDQPDKFDDPEKLLFQISLMSCFNDNTDPRFVPCPECDGNSQPLSTCCGSSFESDMMICLECKEHCDAEVCETCNGEGSIAVDPQDEIDNQADLKHDDI